MKLNIKSKKYIKKVPRLPRNFIKKCGKNENFKTQFLKKDNKSKLQICYGSSTYV